MLDAADDLAAIGQDDCGGVALERGAEGIIRGEEKPGIAAGLHQCLPGGMGEHVGVVGPVQQRNDNSGFHYWASSLDSLVILQTPFFRRRDRCGACPCWLAAPSWQNRR